MMDDAPVIYGLEDFQARALCAMTAETEKINFLVGTQSLRITNQVQLIEFDDDTCLVSKQAFLHPVGEVWKIAAAPQSPHLIATVYNDTQDYRSDYGAAIWKLPIDHNLSTIIDDPRNGPCVELQCHLHGERQGSEVGSQVWSVVWAPEEDQHLITLVDNHVLYWDIEAGGSCAKVISQMSVEGKGSVSVGSGRWYPHQHCSQVAATSGQNVKAWDLRTSKPSWSIEGAHSQHVRDIDFNPNMQYYLATCGDDCHTKFWDIRNTEKPLMDLSDHSHWVWSVRYNASYDQLVLTCSSDQRVILSNLPSIASQPFGTLADQEETSSEKEKESTEKSEDGVIQTYEDHEDSVYAIEWSAADFWTFASLSYDGRLVINKVPRSIKYKQFM
ncbi:EARP-interacting protein homolog [Oratosquilla oratoria]|uniref:EARP-interacting protein homolog n=1 Tax=Oratosquilla oratoria TaxID=337810 RepID=UPI003F76147A